jgi:hypothetical protein
MPVCGVADAVELEGKLSRIGAPGVLAVVNGGASVVGEELQPFGHNGHEGVFDRAGLRVNLAGR